MLPYYTIRDQLEGLVQAFLATRATFYTPNPLGARDSDPLGMIRVHASPAQATSTTRPLVLCNRANATPGSAHQDLARATAEADLLARLGAISAQLEAVPLLHHPQRVMMLTIYPAAARSGRAKLELSINGMGIHPFKTTLPTLMVALRQRLDPLAALPATGPFHLYGVGDRYIWAPSPALALATYAVLRNPADTATTLSPSRAPQVALILDGPALQDEARALLTRPTPKAAR